MFQKPLCGSCDDLTIRPYTLKTLRSLCDLLQANVVLK